MKLSGVNVAPVGCESFWTNSEVGVSFNSFSEFLAMGGHGLYVWLSYGLGVAVLAANLIVPKLGRNRLLAEQKRRLRREEGVR